MPILPTVCNNINMKNVIKFVKSAKSIDVDLLKVHKCRFENVPIFSCSHKNNTLKISHS